VTEADLSFKRITLTALLPVDLAEGKSGSRKKRKGTGKTNCSLEKGDSGRDGRKQIPNTVWK
jgi:hypothetical protein